MKKALAILVAAGALLGVGAGPASAVTITDYAATVEGEATYAHSQSMPVIGGNSTRGEQASFKWSTYFPLVEFVGKKLAVASAGPTTTVTGIEAKTQETVPLVVGPAMTGECKGTQLASPADGGWIGGSPVVDLDPSTEDVGLRMIGDVTIALPSCSGSLRQDDVIDIAGDELEIGLGPFDAVFDLPHEAIDMDRIIQLLEGHESGSKCPGHETFTVSCVLDWKATVTFVRTHQTQAGEAPGELDESHFVPLPSGPQGPPADEDLVVPLVEGEDLVVPLPSGKLGADAAQAKLSVSCSVPCSGTALAYLPSHGASASSTGAAAAKPLAKARFSGKPGHPAKVTLRFPARARGAIKRAGSIRVALRATPLGGGKRVSRSLTLRLPRAGR